MDDLTRLLALVMRELSAEDARLELGGRPPTDARAVWIELRPGARLVALLAAAPTDPKATREHLRAVAEGFDDTLGDAIAGGLGDLAGVRRSTQLTELVDALAILRTRAGAAAAVIVDDASPEIWAADPALPWVTIREAVAAAEHVPDATLTAVARALGRVRDDPDRLEHPAEPPSPEVHAPRLLGIYRVVLVFDAPASPLRITGAIRRGRPLLERLLRSLPPRDPPPRQARVVPIRE